MRFLVINHARLGASPGAIPDHLVTDRTNYSTRAAWFRAIEHAIGEQVHAVFLTGEIISRNNHSLEPFGPLVEGISQLRQANIPVVVVTDGSLTEANAMRFGLDQAVEFVRDRLDWNPPILTNRDQHEGPAIHVVPAHLAESADAPVPTPITLEEMDHAGSIWILSGSCQPDSMRGNHALIIEVGALAPLTPGETGEHGAWIIDTDANEASLIPLAQLEYASIAIDIAEAHNLDDVERIVSQAAVSAADGMAAQTLLVDATLTGATSLFHVLAGFTAELQGSLGLEHEGTSIAFINLANDATPLIDLEPLVGRPDPVGEVARLLTTLINDEEPSESQQQLLSAVDQKLLAVSHARVFGAIVDTPLAVDSRTLLQRQAWASLDTMMRQRGID